MTLVIVSATYLFSRILSVLSRKFANHKTVHSATMNGVAFWAFDDDSERIFLLYTFK